MDQQQPTITGYTNLVNGKKYVGCTKGSVRRRWRQHRSAAKKGSPFAVHAAIRKYGAENFKVEVLETVGGVYADLLAAEMRHIASHHCTSPLGYNLTEGGEGADYLVPGVREKHSEAMRRLPEDPVWRAALAEGIRKRSANPEWRKAQKEGVRKNAESNAVWQSKNAEHLSRINTDPLHRQKHVEAIAKGRAARTAQALAKDARCSTEERARRVRNREDTRRRRQLSSDGTPS